MYIQLKIFFVSNILLWINQIKMKGKNFANSVSC